MNIEKMKKIALIGQVNVGKSTLFNRLIEDNKAIVSQTPGTTRDLSYGICAWRHREFTIIDTGGVEEKKPTDELEKQTKIQINKALKQADFIFFLIDSRPPQELGGAPISNFEREIGRLIRKTKKPCFLIINKSDSPKKREWGKSETWQKLGFGQPCLISAANGAGVGDLLDITVKYLFKNQPLEKLVHLEEKPTRVTIIGRPNVGKSTLLNTLLGKEQVIVSNKPHTTRGPQDTLIYFKKQPFLLVDTAGIRKKTKIEEGIEKIGVQRSLKAIDRSDVVLFVFDLSQEIGHQDKALIRLIMKNKRALIMVFNKNDIAEINPYLEMAPWAPHIFISAKNKTNTDRILPLVKRVMENHNRWIEKWKLTKFLFQVVSEKDWEEKIWSKVEIEQTKTRPPGFDLKIPNIIIRRKQINPAQINTLKKELRKKWSFDGTLINIRY